MRLYMFVAAMAAFLMVGCTETPSVDGTGSAGGTSAAGGDGGRTGGPIPCGALCADGGAGGEAAFTPTVDPGYPMGAQAIVDGVNAGTCTIIAPASNEDGSWARVVLTTPKESFSTVRFAAVQSGTTSAPNPRIFGVGVAPALVGPDGIDCNVYAGNNGTFNEVDSVDATGADGNPVRVSIFAGTIGAVDLQQGDALVLCIGQAVDGDGLGHPTSTVQCGEPGSAIPGRDTWQNAKSAGGAVIPMCDYGPSFCRAIMADALP